MTTSGEVGTEIAPEAL